MSDNVHSDNSDYDPEEAEPEDYLISYCAQNTFEEELNVKPLNLGSNQDFSDGMAIVAIGDKVGAIDRSGKIVVPITYDYLKPFLNGLAIGVIKIDEEK